MIWVIRRIGFLIRRELWAQAVVRAQVQPDA